MASVCNDPGGRKRIIFQDRDGERKPIYLGKCSKKHASEIKTRVETINGALIAGYALDGNTAEWLGTIGNVLHSKLALVGLVAPREAGENEHVCLGDFLDAFLKRRENAKPNSYKNYKQAVGKLEDHFGRAIELRDLSHGMAEEFAIALTEKHSKAYAGRLVKFARQFFHLARREKLIGENPFEGIKASAQTNESRKVFVTTETAAKVLDACPNAEWRLIFALARYGGLRCPSEVLTLRWADVDWEKGRMLVHAPKTEHHEGNGDRLVPIFPELRPYLEEAWDPSAVHVITRNQGAGINLRTQLLRIIGRAGLKPWEKLFQNLRASRETELASRFPMHVVCAWIGNSQRIAAKHYLQVTDGDFDAAIQTARQTAHLTPKTAQNTAQYGARPEHAPNEKTPENPGFLSISPVFSAVDHYTRQESNL